MIHQNKRRAFHKGMVAGKTPAEIAQDWELTELDVVQTLRHPKPKIGWANYNHLKVPIPMDEIIDAYHGGTLEVLGELYGVTKQTIYQRLPQELRKSAKRGRKPKDSRPTEATLLTSEEKDRIVARYYRSGRKLSACGVTSQIAKEVLTEQEISFLKKGEQIPPKDMVTLLDCLLEKTAQGIIEPQVMYHWSRKLYEFKTNSPHVWKGQMLDWLLGNKISQEIIPHINEAIEEIIKLRGYEDADS
jgi:hypothetical protein